MLNRLKIGVFAALGWGMSLSAQARPSVSYLDPVFDGQSRVTGYETKTITDYVVYENTCFRENASLPSGWYVFQGFNRISTNCSLSVTGDVKFVLTDGALLEKAAAALRTGLFVKDGASLTVYAQSVSEKTMGALRIRGGKSAAAIGAGWAVGAQHGSITINGGIVEARGGYDGAGLGGGRCDDGVGITINGGIVTAIGGDYGAGIGGGDQGAGSNIVINAGVVSAKGGENAAGIGGGNDGIGAEIVIVGGSVTVVDKDVERGFTPKNRQGQRVYPVTVDNLVNGANGLVTVEGLSDYGTGFLRAQDGRLTLWLPSGPYDFTVAGCPYSAVVTASSAAAEQEAREPVRYRCPVSDAQGVPTNFVESSCSKYMTIQSTDEFLGLYEGWYVVSSENVYEKPIEIFGEVHLILTDGSSLQAYVTNSAGRAAVHLNGSAMLHVYSQSSDESTMGELIAAGGEGAAGIGGDAGESVHGIFINGGKVSAASGINGAGIGGGMEGDGSRIVVSGGRVTAIALQNDVGTSGAGIGGGFIGCGHDILVCGGTLSFNESSPASAIGSGFGGANAYGLYVLGGNLRADQELQRTALRNRNQSRVYSTPIEHLPAGLISVTGLEGQHGVDFYGTNDLMSVNGQVNLWLPVGTYDFYVNGVAVHQEVTGGGSVHDPVGYLEPIVTDGRVVGFTSCTNDNYIAIDTFCAGGFLDSAWYVVTGECELNEGLVVRGDAKLILQNGAKLTVGSPDAVGRPGLLMNSGGRLTVYGQTEDPSKTGGLIAVGGSGAPGVDGTNCTLVVKSGKVSATGGASSAGIGSAAADENAFISVENQAGWIRATCGADATNDLVAALSTLGGTVKAEHYGCRNRAATIRGGSVEGDWLFHSPTRSSSDSTVVYRVTLAGCWGDGELVSVAIERGEQEYESYGTRGIISSHGKIDLWLANGEYTVYTGAARDAYTFTVDDGAVVVVPHIDYLEPVFDGDGSRKSVTNYVRRVTPAEGYQLWQDADMSGRILGSGWHVIGGKCRIGKDSSLRINGDVKLILLNGATLTKEKGESHNGLIVQSGVFPSSSSSLEIYAQSTDRYVMGAMNIAGGDYCAAIGSGYPDDGHDNAPITINGGLITATGGGYSAGIGSSKKGNAHGITINGGFVTATGGKFGAGIGGGERKDGAGGEAHDIVIRGGTVTAIGGNDAAGIGGGRYGRGASITITGGKVTATGVKYGAGIGGGREAVGEYITVYGGYVTAECKDYGGSGIGGGGDKDSACTGIYIDGGVVVAKGDEHGHSIGGGRFGEVGTIVINGGNVLPEGNDFGAGWPSRQGGGAVYPVDLDNAGDGPVTLTGLPDYYGVKDFATDDKHRVRLWLPVGEYTLRSGFKIYTVSVVDKNHITVEQMDEGGVRYLDYSCESNRLYAACLTGAYHCVSEADTRWGRPGETNWYVAEYATTIDHTVTVAGHVHLILKDNCELTINGGSDDKPGAGINQVTVNGSLTIHGQTEDRVVMGRLKATGGKYCAGIGGGTEEGTRQDGRNITINGGAVEATGGTHGGAGIGGTQDRAGRNITINGGSVKATGGLRGGAGIGGGGRNTENGDHTWGDGENITINGGLIVAKGGEGDRAEDEGENWFESRFWSKNEYWGCGTDIGGGGGFSENGRLRNNPFWVGACMLPFFGDFISGVLFGVQFIMEFHDKYYGGGNCDNLIVNGGTINATMLGGEKLNNFQLNGGSVLAGVFSADPLNSAGDRVYAVALRVHDDEAASLQVPGFGTRDLIPNQECGALCLWLPQGFNEVKMKGERYALVVNGEDDYSFTYLGHDVNVAVDGVKVVDGAFLAGCSYSSATETLTITGPLGHRYVVTGAEGDGRVKLVVENGADLVFSNLLLTAGTASVPRASPVTIASGESDIELLGDSNYFGSHYTVDGKAVPAQGCGINVKPDARVRLFGPGSVSAVAGGGSAAIGGLSGELCGRIEIVGGRIRVRGGKDAAAIGTGARAAPPSGNIADAGPVVVTGGWISELGSSAYAGLGCGYYPESEASKYVNVPVTITDGTVDMAVVAGTTRSIEPAFTEEALKWWWATNGCVKIDGGIFKGEVVHGGSYVDYALNSHGEMVFSNRGDPIYTGTASGELVTNLVVESVRNYGDRELRAVRGYLYLWLPEDTTLKVRQLDGSDAAFTGISVNERDLAWYEGDGWRYDRTDGVLALEKFRTFRVHESDYLHPERDLRIVAATNVHLALDGVCLRPRTGAPVQVLDGFTAYLDAIVSNSLVAVDSAAIELNAKSEIYINKHDDPSLGTEPSLTVLGGAHSPGIGTVVDDDSAINISELRLDARGRDGAAGIGNGGSGRSPCVKIFSGRVTADRIGHSAAGGTQGGVAISGGTVETEVLGASAEVADQPALVISGGSVKAGAFKPQPVNESRITRVYETPLAYPYSGPANITGLGSYGIRDLYATSDGNLHLWLPVTYDGKDIILDGNGRFPLTLLTTVEGGEAYFSVNPDAIRTDYTEEEVDAILAKRIVARPTEEVRNAVLPLVYDDYFDVSKKLLGEGPYYTLEVELKDAVKQQMKDALEAALPGFVATMNPTNEIPFATVDALAGLYYGIAGSTNLAEVESSEIPVAEWKIGHGVPLKVPAASPADRPDRAFYQLRARR